MKKNITTVPFSVWENVEVYLEDNLPKYQMIDVFRKSQHPDDHYLYMVIAKNCSNGYYSVWTCWNDMTETLNNGHYMIEDIMDAYQIVVQNYTRIN